jgi:hypothetical protein
MIDVNLYFLASFYILDDKAMAEENKKRKRDVDNSAHKGQSKSNKKVRAK